MQELNAFISDFIAMSETGEELDESRKEYLRQEWARVRSEVLGHGEE